MQVVHENGDTYRLIPVTESEPAYVVYGRAGERERKESIYRTTLVLEVIGSGGNGDAQSSRPASGMLYPRGTG